MTEITGTDAYQWLLGELDSDAKNALNCLATESVENVRYAQGKLYGLRLAAELLREPWRRLDKLVEQSAVKSKGGK